MKKTTPMLSQMKKRSAYLLYHDEVHEEETKMSKEKELARLRPCAKRRSLPCLKKSNITRKRRKEDSAEVHVEGARSIPKQNRREGEALKKC